MPAFLSAGRRSSWASPRRWRSPATSRPSNLLTPRPGPSSARAASSRRGAIIIAITIPNLLGHRQSAWTQNLTTMLKLACSQPWRSCFPVREGPVVPHRARTALRAGGTGDRRHAVVHVMFAYSGWNAAGYLAGEVKDPGRTLPARCCGRRRRSGAVPGPQRRVRYAVPLDSVGFDNAEQVPAVGGRSALRAAGFRCLLRPAGAGLPGHGQRVRDHGPQGLLLHGH
jgi:hypothetical protein